MAEGRRHDIIYIVLLAIAIAAYASVQTEFRLRSQMPAEFFDASRAPAAKRAAEEKIASAFWKCAVNQVQWKYGYAHRLPEEPVPEFVVTPEQVGSAAHDQALRVHYWQKLRDVWGISTVWHKEYEWNPSTLQNSLQSAGQWLELHMRRIIGSW
jgi:hypothetical protein